MKAEWADELGVARSSGMFGEALLMVGQMNRHTVNTKLNNIKSLGFSQEITLMIRKYPRVLALAEEPLRSKGVYLLKEADSANN
jgi:mTERF